MARLPATPIKDSQLFKRESVRLSHLITPRRLLVELNRVYRAGVGMLLDLGDGPFVIDISGSFHWDATPQGWEFWSELDKGEHHD